MIEMLSKPILDDISKNEQVLNGDASDFEQIKGF